MPHFCIFSVLGNWPNFIFSLNLTLSPICCTYIWYFVLQFVVYIRLHFCIQSFVYLPLCIFVSNLLFICLYVFLYPIFCLSACIFINFAALCNLLPQAHTATLSITLQLPLFLFLFFFFLRRIFFSILTDLVRTFSPFLFCPLHYNRLSPIFLFFFTYFFFFARPIFFSAYFYT